MKTWKIEKFGSIDGLALTERPDPAPEPHEIVVRVHANSLNYRDLMVVTGRYRSSLKPGLVPLSDGAGEVVATGKRVTRVKAGERVAAIFHQRWIGGRLLPEYTGSDLGGSVDGVINYRETPDWDQAVAGLTGGRGVDYVVEVGGPATLPRSIKAAGLGGHITLIGIIGSRSVSGQSSTHS